GHCSHVSDEIRQLALQNNIHLFCLPPKTTHKLQPLNVGVFGPLQSAWTHHCEAIVAQTGCEMPCEDFISKTALFMSKYMAVCDKAFSPSLIKAAWRKSGLAPIDP
ncbi:hypothetical protein SCLCIDRAFT_98010, partial [Scleroderma citrinum Foug A]